MTARRSALLVAVLAAATAVAAFSWFLSRPPGRPVASASPGASAPGPRPGSVALVTSSDMDSIYDAKVNRQPTAGTNQPRLWQAAGTWWGTLVASSGPELRIARRDPATGRFVDTGTLVDARARVRAAVSWAEDRLAVVTAGDKPEATAAARITTFHLDPKTGRFAIDPDVPVALSATGVSSPTLARDGSGVLWFAAISDARLVVRHTLGDDRLWSPDRAAEVTNAGSGARTVSLLWSGDRTVLAWSRTGDSTLQVALHVDGDPDDRWAASSTDVEGLRDAPGDLALAATSGTPDPRLLVAFQAADSATGGSLAPAAVVVSRSPDGSWSSAQLGRAKDHLRTPILAVDEAHDVLLAIAATTEGQIVIKPSPLGRIGFESGTGITLIGSGSQVAAADPTSASGPIDLAQGLVVLAADDASGQYLHGVVRLGGSGGPSPAPSVPAPSSSPPGAPSPLVLRIETFDPWPVDGQPPGWDLEAQAGGRGSAAIVAIRSATNRSLRVATTSAGGSVRACMTTSPVGAGQATITSLVRIGRLGISDTTLGSVRGPGGEAASLRVTRHGFLAYYAGAVKKTTTSSVGTGAWYRLRIDVDVADHTWGWSIATTGGRVVARAAAIAWRQADVPSVDTFCVQPGEGSGSALILDDLVVAR